MTTSLGNKHPAEDYAQVRERLSTAISRSCTPHVGSGRIKLPLPQAGTPLEIAVSYEPFRRFHLAQQREMETHIAPLRARLRAALRQAAPKLHKLAALDEALDEILASRESKLLATLPALMERRFQHFLGAHQQKQAESGLTDDPALWMQADGWMAGFCKELQAVLHAELDLRLQPALGLLEAFSNETPKH